MNIATITPIFLQQPNVLRILLKNVQTWKGSHHIFLCNRLSNDLISIDNLNKLLKNNTDGEVLVINDKERSVAGAWNKGISLAKDIGIEICHILAFDVGLHPNSQKTILNEFNSSDFDMLSSIQYNDAFNSNDSILPFCDFSSVIFRPSIINKFGWFDREYKPAYFEDNDYAIRLKIGNGKLGMVTEALHYHMPSSTIRFDPEAAHHVSHWFENNRNRFISKWGHSPTDDTEFIKNNFHKGPCGTNKELGWWPESDKENYSYIGGIHD